MADEATVQSSLQIRSSAGTLQYRSNPTAFTADVAGNKGPAPGAFTVSVTGTNLDLSELSRPGLFRVMNLEPEAAGTYVIFGPYDGASFYPMLKVLPGETFVGRFYPFLADEFVGTGTNTDTNQIRFLSIGGAASVVLVEAFEE